MTHKRTFLKMFAAGLALAFMAGATTSVATAGEKNINSIIKSLAPIDGQKVTRGYGGKRKTRRIDDVDVVLDYEYSIDIEIYFPYDSARLTGKARRQLNILGRALNSPELRSYRYLLAGHTDARGTRAYNKDLSERRAAAAKYYLIDRFAINPRRLLSVGWGEDDLKSPNYPAAAINRRVQVIMVLPDDRGENDTYTPKRDMTKLSTRTVPANGELPVCTKVELMDLDDFHRRPGVDCVAPQGWESAKYGGYNN